MTTKATVFEGACGTADTEAQLGAAAGKSFDSSDSRIIGMLAAVGDEGVQEPHDASIELKFNNIAGDFQFTVCMGGATASAASFQLSPAMFIPLDIPVEGSTIVKVYATSSGTPEAVRVSLIYE